MKKLLFKIIRYSGLPFLFREVVQKRKVTGLAGDALSEVLMQPHQESTLLQPFESPFVPIGNLDTHEHTEHHDHKVDPDRRPFLLAQMFDDAP